SGATSQMAWSHIYAARALRELGRLDESVTSALQAAEMFKAIGDTDAYVQSLAGVGGCLRDEGRYAEALEHYLDLLALMDDQHSGMTASVAAHSRPLALIRVGQCLGDLGRRAEAITRIGEGIDLLDALQMSDFRQAEALEALAVLLAKDGRTGESRRAF